MKDIELSEGISETLDILNHMEKIYVDKLPTKFIAFLENNKSKSYICCLDHSKKLSEMNLKESTKDILAAIYMHYWADSKQKIYYNNFLIENENKYQEELRKKYNLDNLFECKKQAVNTNYSLSKNLAIIEYKETIFTKAKNWLKRILNK